MDIEKPTLAVALYLKMIDEEYDLGFITKDDNNRIDGIRQKRVEAFVSVNDLRDPRDRTKPISPQNVYRTFRKMFFAGEKARKALTDFEGTAEHVWAVAQFHRYKAKKAD